MKIEQLIQVIEVAKTNSITLAAKNMFMSQSNLSTSIKELENEIQQQIFIRSNNGTTLTPFGEAFLKQAKLTIKQFEYIKNMSSFHGKWNEKFSIASYYFLFAAYIFLEIFEANKNTHMIFDFKECSRRDIIHMVANKETELGILSVPSTQKNNFVCDIAGKGLEYHKMTSEKPHILVGEGSPFFPENISSVKLSDLSSYPIIAYEDTDLAAFGIESSNSNLLSPSSIIYVSDRQTLLQFLQGSDGYHIATKNPKAYQQYLFHEKTRAIPIEDISLELEIGWLKSKDTILSEFGQQFLFKMQEKLVLEQYIV